MALRINGAVSAKDVADARQQARVLKTAVAGRHPSAQVEIKAGTLKSILKVVDAVSVELLERGSRHSSDVTSVGHAADRKGISASAQGSFSQPAVAGRGHGLPTQACPPAASGPRPSNRAG